MKNVLGLDQKPRLEGRKIILFLDNVSCHPETLQSNLTNMRLIFLLKCTMSCLQPFDAGIRRRQLNFWLYGQLGEFGLSGWQNNNNNLKFQGLIEQYQVHEIFVFYVFYYNLIEKLLEEI